MFDVHTLRHQSSFRTNVLVRVSHGVFEGIGVSGSSHWELMGDAVVTTDHVRLTSDQQSKQGAVWSRMVSVPDRDPRSLLIYSHIVSPKPV